LKYSIKTIIPAVIAVSAVALTVFLVLLAHASFGQISDLPEFYAAARMVLAGRGTDVYLLPQQLAAQQALFPALGQRMIGFFLLPFSLAWIVPIGWVPVEIVRYVWKALLLAALGLSLWLIKRVFQLDAKGTLWLISVALFSGCAYEALRIDQIAFFLLLAWCTLIWALQADRPLIAAIMLSFLMLKPQEVLPFLVFLLGARRYRVLFLFAVCTALVALVSFIELGLPGVMNYQTLMASTVENSKYLQADISPTLRGQLYRLFPSAKSLWTVICSIIHLVALGYIFWAGRKFRRAAGWIQAGVLVAMPLGLVTTLYYFDYDLIVLLPALVVLMKPQLQDLIAPWQLLLAMMGGLIFMLPFSIYIHYYYFLNEHGLINPNFWPLLVFSLWLIYFVNKNFKAFDLWVE